MIGVFVWEVGENTLYEVNIPWTGRLIWSRQISCYENLHRIRRVAEEPFIIFAVSRGVAGAHCSCCIGSCWSCSYEGLLVD